MRTISHLLKLGVLTAKYSRVDSLSDMKEDYLQLVNEWEEVWEPDYYNKNLKMISLAVLFEVDNTIIDKIKKMLQNSNINDWLFLFLLNGITGNLSFDDELDLPVRKSFKTLRTLVNEENKTELLKRYLTKEWYNKDCGCYGAHKSKQDVYYGYWSFEAGAVAKILKIDDEELKNVKYYPYDLVHFAP